MRVPSFNPVQPESSLYKLTKIKSRVAEINRQLNGPVNPAERKSLLDELFKLMEEELTLEHGKVDTRGIQHFTTSEERDAANDSQPQKENLAA